MKKYILVLIPLIFIFDLQYSVSQEILSAQINQNFRQLIVDEIIFEIQQIDGSNQIISGSILISISEKSEINLQLIPGKGDHEDFFLGFGSVECFQEKLRSLNLDLMNDCVFLLPFVLRPNTNVEFEDNLEKTIQKLFPEIRFERVGCLHYLPPYIGLK
ncbi:hypothetical protein [Algoriphagus namhaensis]